MEAIIKYAREQAQSRTGEANLRLSRKISGAWG